jgi:hypothetical protein
MPVLSTADAAAAAIWHTSLLEAALITFVCFNVSFKYKYSTLHNDKSVISEIAVVVGAVSR